jgi:UTP--glucose-1-phosphate uridylyltransferase
MTLADELDQLPEQFRAVLERHRFNRERLLEQAARFIQGLDRDNRVKGRVEPPEPSDLAELPEAGSAEWKRLQAIGLEALRVGHCALVVLAGGMATRMGGGVKALMEALPGKSFLDLRLAELSAIERQVGRAAPLWLMTSYATDKKIRKALGGAVDGERIAVFTQHLSLRITPSGDLFYETPGNPSEYAPGHGDLPDALKESSLISRFVERGGEVVTVANLDNLGATLDPVVLGFHLDHGAAVTCEVVDNLGSDRGGIPARVDGHLEILEDFRLPEGFDSSKVGVFNSNTFHFNARALSEFDFEFTFFAVRKKVDDRDVIQFERVIGELTSRLETRFLRVPRAGSASRFLPVKDPDELERRRPEIEAVARARGMLP